MNNKQVFNSVSFLFACVINANILGAHCDLQTFVRLPNQKVEEHCFLSTVFQLISQTPHSLARYIFVARTAALRCEWHGPATMWEQGETERC